MKHVVAIVFLAFIVFIQGCATTNQFKKEEPVKLILENGDKIKCYVTHIGRGQIFFKALSSQMAYRYGDMITTGQVKVVVLSNDTELSVSEYKEYRTNMKKALLEEAELAAKGEFFDAHYEKLKKKDINKMSDREFRYFILMKERENLLRLKKMDEARETKRLEEMQLLQQKITQMEQNKEVTTSPPVVQIIEKPIPALSSPQFQVEPKPILPPNTNILKAYNSDVAQLVLEAGLTADLLRKSDQKRQGGLALSPNQEQFLAEIEKSSQWQKRKEKLLLWNLRAEQALKQCFLKKPEDLKLKLALSFDANEPMNFPVLMRQLQRKMGFAMNMNDYQKLIDVVGEIGAEAIKNILSNFNDWQFVVENQR